MKKTEFNKITFLICFWISCAIFITFYDGCPYSFAHPWK